MVRSTGLWATASVQQLLSLEAPPSPLSSRPKRSEVERSAVQRLCRGNVFRLAGDNRTLDNHRSLLNPESRCEPVLSTNARYSRPNLESAVNCHRLGGTDMRLILGFVLAFAIGAVCRLARIPSPAPNALIGSLLVVSMSVGYIAAGRALARPIHLFPESAHAVQRSISGAKSCS
jgi:XapX domain-containing protein